MNWVKKQSSFKYCGKPVTRTTMTCSTPLGIFKVYEAVGGSVFIIHPFMTHDLSVIVKGKLFIGDPDETFCMNVLRIRVKSLEDGIKACEEKWKQVKKAVNKT